MFLFKFKTTPLFRRRKDIVHSMIFIVTLVVSEVIAFMVLRVYHMRSENIDMLQSELDWCYAFMRESYTVA